MIEESFAVIDRYLKLEPGAPDSSEGYYGVAWHYRYAAELTLDPPAKLHYLEMAKDRMEFNADLEGEGGTFWLSNLDEIYEEIEAVRTELKASGEHDPGEASFSSAENGESREYEIYHYIGQEGEPNGFKRLVCGLYNYIARIYECLPELGPFKIRKNTARRTDLPPYTPPRHLPDDYRQFSEVLHNMKELNFLQLSLITSGLNKRYFVRIYLTFNQDYSTNLQFCLSNTSDHFVRQHHEALMQVAAAAFEQLGVKYALELIYANLLDWCQLPIHYGWALICRAEDFGQTQFPVSEIAPGLIRISSISPQKIFDSQNSEHLEKGKELEAAVLANKVFVEKIDYIFARESHDF